MLRRLSIDFMSPLFCSCQGKRLLEWALGDFVIENPWQIPTYYLRSVPVGYIWEKPVPSTSDVLAVPGSLSFTPYTRYHTVSISIILVSKCSCIWHNTLLTYYIIAVALSISPSMLHYNVPTADPEVAVCAKDLFYLPLRLPHYRATQQPVTFGLIHQINFDC